MNMRATIKPPSTKMRGFTLIELMISLLLGTLVVAAAGGIFLSNRRVYGSTESINRIQENQRTAFEIMSRDIREAGGNPCSRNVVNMLDTSKPTGSYWDTWQGGVAGVEGGGAAPDEITLSLANVGGATVTGNANPAAEITLTNVDGFSDGDVAIICNPEVTAIFQIQNVQRASGSSPGLVRNSGNGSGTPGNQVKPFKSCPGWRSNDPNEADDDDCEGESNSYGYCFATDVPKHNGCSRETKDLPAQVVRPYAVRWFLRTVNRSGRNVSSLYRQTITNSVGGAADEIAEGVTNMQIQYKRGAAGAFENASAGWTTAQWQTVTAVRVVLTLQATTGALSTADTRGTDNQTLTRTLGDVVALRNRIDVQ